MRKSIKKSIKIIVPLSLLLLFSLVGGIISANATVITDLRWSNFADTSWYDGEGAASGTEDDPYVIKTAEQLAGLASLVYNCKTTFSGSYFVLDSDIDLQNREWLPIGWLMRDTAGYNYGFAGNFDGRGRSITGLLVTELSNNTTDIYDYTSECAALFGYVTTEGSISNLYVKGVVTVDDADGAAVLVGKNRGKITNCVVYGDEVSVSTQEGKSWNGYVGGIAAVDGGGTISNCVSYGRYTAEASGWNYAAGFVGYASQSGYTTFKNCVGLAEKAQAGIAQGMIGANLTNCYYLTGGEETPSGPGMGGGAIGNWASLTATAIFDESAAPVSAVLFAGESLRAVAGEEHTIRLAAYPESSPRDGIVCEWLFDDGDEPTLSENGLSATINTTEAGEKYFTVTVTGINGIEENDTDNAIVLRGKLLIDEETNDSAADNTPTDDAAADDNTPTDDAAADDEPSASTSGGGSGGCNGGFGAVALFALAFAPFVMKDRKRARS